jgi:hypothetical protein
MVYLTPSNDVSDAPSQYTVLKTVANFDGTTVSLTSTAVAAVPEPSTYAMLLAGLGAVGFIARRRKA